MRQFTSQLLTSATWLRRAQHKNAHGNSVGSVLVASESRSVYASWHLEVSCPSCTLGLNVEIGDPSFVSTGLSKPRTACSWQKWPRSRIGLSLRERCRVFRLETRAILAEMMLNLQTGVRRMLTYCEGCIKSNPARVDRKLLWERWRPLQKYQQTISIPAPFVATCGMGADMQPKEYRKNIAKINCMIVRPIIALALPLGTFDETTFFCIGSLCKRDI